MSEGLELLLVGQPWQTDTVATAPPYQLPWFTINPCINTSPTRPAVSHSSLPFTSHHTPHHPAFRSVLPPPEGGRLAQQLTAMRCSGGILASWCVESPSYTMLLLGVSKEAVHSSSGSSSRAVEAAPAVSSSKAEAMGFLHGLLCVFSSMQQRFKQVAAQ